MAITASLIESETNPADYRMPQTTAIVDTPDGRYLIANAFGGQSSMAGGSIRWRHGLAVQLQPTDTLASLHAGEWNDHTSLLEAVMHGEDRTRPMLDWSGHHVEAVAKAAGLTA